MTGSIKRDWKLNDLNQNSGESKRGIVDCEQGFGGEAFEHSATWETPKLCAKAVDKHKRKHLKVDHLRQRRITAVFARNGRNEMLEDVALNFLTSAQLAQREYKTPRGIVVVILERTETFTAEN